jgi:hypothetical protein
LANLSVVEPFFLWIVPHLTLIALPPLSCWLNCWLRRRRYQITIKHLFIATLAAALVAPDLARYIRVGRRIGPKHVATWLWETSRHTLLIVLAGSLLLTWGWYRFRRTGKRITGGADTQSPFASSRDSHHSFRNEAALRAASSQASWR